jgi:hypothetical protein
MELNPAECLELLQQRLRQCSNPYRSRGETLQHLKTALNRAACEGSDLGHRMARDPAARSLYRQLVCWIELGKGIIRE